MKLKNRVALITGGGQGIGESICYVYAKEGASIVIVDKNLHTAQKVASKISEEGGQARAIQCDITKTDSVKKMMDEVLQEFGKVDIVLNNAGIYIGKAVEDCTEKDWDTVVNLNLKGTFLVSQAAVPSMKKNRYGKIICISSIMGSVGALDHAAYCASKAGVIGLVKALAVELAPYKINVNALSPGFVATALNAAFRSNPKIVESLRQRTPSGEAYMDASELSGAAVFLASDDSQAVHGLDLRVDNGWCII